MQQLSDEEKIAAVTAKLTGRFYVGQPIRHRTSGRLGEIHFLSIAEEGFVVLVYVTWRSGRTQCLYPGEIDPA